MTQYEILLFSISFITMFFYTSALLHMFEYGTRAPYKYYETILLYCGTLYLLYLPDISTLIERSSELVLLRSILNNLWIPLALYCAIKTSQIQIQSQKQFIACITLPLIIYSILCHIPSIPSWVSNITLVINVGIYFYWARYINKIIDDTDPESTSNHVFLGVKRWPYIIAIILTIWSIHRIFFPYRWVGYLIDIFVYIPTILVFANRYNQVLRKSEETHSDKVIGLSSDIISNADDTESNTLSIYNFENSNLSSEKNVYQTIHKKLEVLERKGKFFLDSSLTIGSLAEKLDTNRTYLSNYFSSRNTSFSEYIEKLRVDHSIELMKKEPPTTNIDNISTRSGFGSRSTYYKAFAKHYGTTPKKYRERFK